MGSQRLRHNWATFISLHFKPCNMHPKDFTICPLSALPTSARKASPWLYPWRLSSTTVFFMKPPHPNTHIHSSAFKVLCLYLTLLIKMFHFSSRTGNILSIPSTEPNKILRNPFVYWISENTSFLIFRLYTLQLHRPSTPGVLLWQFSGPPTYHTKRFSGLLLTTEINYLEWFWLCIPGSYQKDYFFRRCLSTFHIAVSQVTAVVRYFEYQPTRNCKKYEDMGKKHHEFKIFFKKSFLSTMNTVFNTFTSNKRIIMTCNRRLSNDVSHKTF